MIQIPLSCFVVNKSVNKQADSIRDAINKDTAQTARQQNNINNLKMEYFKVSNKFTDKIYFYAENIYYLYYMISTKFDLDKKPDGTRSFDIQYSIAIKSFVAKCDKFVKACMLLKESVSE
jgi:predicted solute-binding protein